MTALPAQKQRFASPVKTVHTLPGLEAIHDPDLDAVILDRQIPAALTSALEHLPRGKDLKDAQDGRFQLETGRIGEGVRATLRAWDMPGSPALEWLVNDVQMLAGKFSKILSVDQLKLRVELVRDDACAKFHRDNVRARLIATYYGPGTEYVTDEDLKAESAPDNLAEPTDIHKVPTGAAVIFKGKKWPERPAQTIRHRSPPIEGRGITRLVIVLDAGPAI